MKIFFEKTGKEEEHAFSGKVSELLKVLDINKEEVIIVCRDEIILPEDHIDDSDSIKILSVVSGG
ncbi:thiamine biosynthesis protein ThiS [Candidatus Woesearchaeota archaeon CG11_big_fil_rev_8_21_14_0_20_43_8]|nr:MAG: thiamine biosynthesis protein ThiS [Candidatus Woesearchaeota archaeon CG11_big_fil_rev_8_21_14_0_20_43_8]